MKNWSVKIDIRVIRNKGQYFQTFFYVKGPFKNKNGEGENCMFCSFVIWGDFELWKIANLSRSEKVGKITLNLLRKKHFSYVEKGYENFYGKLAKPAQVKK